MRFKTDFDGYHAYADSHEKEIISYFKQEGYEVIVLHDRYVMSAMSSNHKDYCYRIVFLEDCIVSYVVYTRDNRYSLSERVPTAVATINMLEDGIDDMQYRIRDIVPSEESYSKKVVSEKEASRDSSNSDIFEGTLSELLALMGYGK